MCLQLKPNYEKKIASEDIPVYKTLISCIYGENKGKMVTPYRKVVIEIGKTYKATIRVNKKYVQCEEGLHSFKYKKDALQDIMDNGYDVNYIVKCIIPKGSIYYIGMFDHDLISYCSNKLTYVKIIKTIEL